MNLSEINQRVGELEKSIIILTSLRKGFTESGADADVIKALGDGIHYTEMRLEQYRTADWIMADGVFN